jgi:hypothetical protein
MSELTKNVKTSDNESVHSKQESDNESENSSVNSDNTSVYSEVNLQDDRLYQILSTFFENEEGDNLTTILSNINENIQVQNKILTHIAQSFQNMQIKIGGDDDSDNNTQNSDNSDNESV